MSSVDRRTELKDLLLERVSTRMDALGFCPSDPKTSFHRKRSGGLVDCVSLLIDYGTENESVLCTVNVGIGCLSSNLNLSQRKCALTWNIGYLMPGRKWLEWDLSEPERVNGTLNEIFQSLESVAIPWLERFETPTDVLREQSQNQPRGFGNLVRTAQRRSWAS